jgi:hypothetical protein
VITMHTSLPIGPLSAKVAFTSARLDTDRCTRRVLVLSKAPFLPPAANDMINAI